MRANLHWRSDDEWGQIEPHLLTDVRGVKRVEIVSSSAGSCMYKELIERRSLKAKAPKPGQRPSWPALRTAT